jgi:UDP-glucose 4-epimerase
MSHRVLVTHADEPLGRRIVKTLFHDAEVDRIHAVGGGGVPHSFDRFLRASGERMSYARVDLTKHRAAADLFHSDLMRRAAIDTVVHVPHHAALPQSSLPLLAGVSERTAEARMVLQHCLEQPSIKHLVALGSAFVYRLQPGNANRFTETSELDFDSKVPAEIRAWIDCDMIFHGEIHNELLRVALLRLPSVVSSGGYVFFNPALAPSGGPRVHPMGYDPLCTLISDKDVAQAAQLAVRRRADGIFNVSGAEVMPLSQLARWTGGASWSVPGPLLSGAARALRRLRLEGPGTTLDSDHLRYGFTLDTRKAERELGYRPGYRVGLAPAGDGRLQLETALM